jgi:hypothetical protein
VATAHAVGRTSRGQARHDGRGPAAVRWTGGSDRSSFCGKLLVDVEQRQTDTMRCQVSVLGPVLGWP